MAFDFMHSDFPPLRLYALRQLLKKYELFLNILNFSLWKSGFKIVFILFKNNNQGRQKAKLKIAMICFDEKLKLLGNPHLAANESSHFWATWGNLRPIVINTVWKLSPSPT